MTEEHPATLQHHLHETQLATAWLARVRSGSPQSLTLDHRYRRRNHGIEPILVKNAAE